MVIYFTTNENFYSRLLRWIFSEPVSHVGACLYPTGKTAVVIDCTKPHGRIYAYNCWTKKNFPIFGVDIPMKEEDEIYCFDKMALRSVLRPYDLGAYIYGFYWGLRIKFFGSKPPRTNDKSHHEKDLCTEIFHPIKDILLKYGIDLFGIDLAAMTPYMLAQEIYRQTKDNASIRWIAYQEILDNLSDSLSQKPQY